MIWFPTAIMKPQKHKNHMFIDFFNNWISAPFFPIHMTSCHIHSSFSYLSKKAVVGKWKWGLGADISPLLVTPAPEIYHVSIGAHRPEIRPNRASAKLI